MSNRRMLNQDYFKVDAKYVRHGIPQEELKQEYRVLEVKVKRNSRYSR